MPSVIISRPSGATDKVLRRSEYAKEMVGLETLAETYTILSSARISLQPARNTLHSAYSSAGTKYSRMAVETVSFREMEGDLTEMTVTYVGLTSSSGLPPAVISITPTTGAGIYGPPIVIQANFLSDQSETELLSGKGVSVGLGPYSSEIKPMPPSINGTTMPSNPVQPFTRSAPYLVTQYFGYVLNNMQSIRRGLFLVVTSNYQEFQASTVAVAGSFSSGKRPISKGYATNPNASTNPTGGTAMS